MARRASGWLGPTLLGGGAIAAIAWLASRRSRSPKPSVSVGAGTTDDFLALGRLRSFRGKLNSVIARNPDNDRLMLWISSSPPQGSGTIGGDDLALSLDNLGLVNWSLVVGADPKLEREEQVREAVIPFERLAPSEWRREFEAWSKENAEQLLARVSQAIDRIESRVYARS